MPVNNTKFNNYRDLFDYILIFLAKVILAGVTSAVSTRISNATDGAARFQKKCSAMSAGKVFFSILGPPTIKILAWPFMNALESAPNRCPPGGASSFSNIEGSTSFL